MSKMTFVVEYEDGKEPLVHAGMQAFGGKVVSARFSDYQDSYISEHQRDLIESGLKDMVKRWRITDESVNVIMSRIDLLTK